MLHGKIKTSILTLIAAMLFTYQVIAQNTKIDFTTSEWPKVFANGLISDGLSNRDIAISPDGSEIYYTIQHKNGLYSCIMVCKKTAGGWTQPQKASFSGLYNDLEPAFAPGGRKLFFVSNRPPADTGRGKDYDIWWVEKNGNEWSKPVNAGSIVNTAKDEFYPSVASNGNLYFTRDVGDAKEDILLSRWEKSAYTTPVSLPVAINSPGYEFNAFVSPNEDYILFTGYKRKDEMGGGDLYISFREGEEWKEAQNLTRLVNSPFLDYCPFVSWDQKALFFTSNRTAIKSPLPPNTGDIRTLLSSSGNGYDDVYFLDFQALLKALGRSVKP